MNILLTMNFTGSVLLIIYYLVKHIFGRRLTRKYLYAILRVDVACFLVPLILVGEIYKSIWADLVLLSGGNLNITVWVDLGDALFLEKDGGFGVSRGMREKILLLSVYILVVAAIFVLKFFAEKRRRSSVRMAIRESGIRIDADLLNLQREYGIRRKVELCSCEEESQIATVGMFHPVIFFKDSGDDFRKRVLLSHELYHIKRQDVLWRWVSFLACCIHFWNPASHILYRELMRLQERSCDEWVIRDMNLADRGRYASLLVRYSTEGSGGRKDRFRKIFKGKNRSVVFFGEEDSEKYINERVDLILRYDKKNKIGRKFATLLTALVLFASSLTALAYDDIRWWGGEGEGTLADRSEGAVNVSMDNGIVFLESHESETAQEYPIVTESIGANGDACSLNAPAEDGASPQVFCIFHSYKDYKVVEHYTLPSGGCEVWFYDSVRCQKCGRTKSITLTAIDRFDECPHTIINN